MTTIDCYGARFSNSDGFIFTQIKCIVHNHVQFSSNGLQIMKDSGTTEGTITTDEDHTCVYLENKDHLIN